MSPDEYELAVEFIEGFEAADYDWSVTLTSDDYHWVMESIFDQWISKIEQEDGATEWVRVTEPGVENSFLLHVFIGGRESRHRYKWMRLWPELGGVSARTRFMGDTEKLRGLLRYFVLRRYFGLKTRSKWKRQLDIKGWNEWATNCTG